jgi:hypothetical protein
MSDIVIIVVLGMLGLIWYNSREIISNKIKCSGPHSWGYDTNDQMYCKKCKTTPGNINE